MREQGTWSYTDEALAREAQSNISLARWVDKQLTKYGIGKDAPLLDVGCGPGQLLVELRRVGYSDVTGIEPGVRSDFIRPEVKPLCFIGTLHEYVQQSKRTFGAIVSFGVIEHVGTLDGHQELGPNTIAERRQFLSDIAGLLKPSGVALISCPNRNFPLDFQHDHLYARKPFTIPWHRKNFLLSVDDIRNLSPSHVHVEPLKQTGYLAFQQFTHRPKLVSMVKAYCRLVDLMPLWISQYIGTHTLVGITRRHQ